MDFFVLRSEEGQPPRAAISSIVDAQVVDGELMIAAVTGVAVWSSDNGTWMVDGNPLPEETAQLITERARALEVEGFGGG